MEDRHFDALVVRLARGFTRRNAIAALATAGSLSQIEDNAEARRKKKKVTICRNGQTLTVTKQKKRKHLKPGDTAGACSPPRTTTPPRCQPSAPNFCARLDACLKSCPSDKVFDPNSCACICPVISTCCSCTRGADFLCFPDLADAGACTAACSGAGGTDASFVGGNGGSAVCDLETDSCRVTCEPERMDCACAAGKSCCQADLGGCCPVDTPFCCPVACCPATAPLCCKANCCAVDARCCDSTDDCDAGQVCESARSGPGGCCVPAP
ncbi:MAG: hypothetical protein U0Z70_06345 [Thermomicrobiales bacterium]